MTGSKRSLPRVLTATAFVVVTAVALTGCQGAVSGNSGGSANAGGTSVPFGASDAEWASAFEDAEPIELVMQSANSATSLQGKLQAEEWSKLEEMTDGKVTVELVFGDAIAANVEADEALADGRIDLHLLVPFLQPSDYPVSGQFALETTITRDSPIVSGTLASFGAINESLLQTDELITEYADANLTVINPLVHTGNVVMACAEPLTSLDDLKGKQVRVGPEPAFGQVEALGATPVSVAYADLFESLQRGIVDCMIIGLTTMQGIPGMIDLVPYLISPAGTGFVSTPGIEVVGGRWSEFSLPLQQLIWDTFHRIDLLSVENFVSVEAENTIDDAEAAGGGLLTFDQEVSDALKAHNDEIKATWDDSALVDGVAFTERLDDAYKKWDALIAEAGYSSAETADVEDWRGVDTDWTAFERAYHENVTIPNRPGAK